MAQVRSKEVRICVELGTKILQEVRLCRIEVVRLDSVDSLRVATERYHIVYLARYDRGILEVIERGRHPRVRLNHILIGLDEVFNRLYWHGPALHQFNLKVGSLIHELFVGADADLAPTRDAEEDEERQSE